VPECRNAQCGDGQVFAGLEECDDGNDSNADQCLDNCQDARCGDGYLQIGEACDSANDPACSSSCTPGRCGDGVVERGVEACDDGNNVNGDGCDNDCNTVVCGDGYTAVGFEDCDYEDPAYKGICTAECKQTDICGDSNADGAVTVTDARRILVRSVRPVHAVSPRRRATWTAAASSTCPTRRWR
jgi:cysteine-rich repeat protein